MALPPNRRAILRDRLRHIDAEQQRLDSIPIQPGDTESAEGHRALTRSLQYARGVLQKELDLREQIYQASVDGNKALRDHALRRAAETQARMRAALKELHHLRQSNKSLYYKGKGIADPCFSCLARLITILALIWKGSPKGGSTRVAKDDKNRVIYIKSKMEFRGPDASVGYALAAKKQIERAWSGKTTINGKKYRVVSIVVVRVNRNPVAPASAGYDQIIVDSATEIMSQTLYGAGPGHQTPAAANDAGRPRRIAHEYGHTLGLEDEYHDEGGRAVPDDPEKKNNIMAETWPDAHGQLPAPHPDHYEKILEGYGY